METMPVAFQSVKQERLFDAVVTELHGIGYQGDLLQREYGFRDWFHTDNPERRVDAAAFGATPPSYDNACFGIVAPSGEGGVDYVTKFRSLGAPFLFEIRADNIVQWRIGRDTATTTVQREIKPEQIRRVFADERQQWNGSAVLRAKNIIFSTGPRQLDFIDLGLIPALEQHVHEKLDPLLRETLVAATKVYAQSQRRDPDPRELFRLTFWLLASKILHDRQIEGFKSLSAVSETDLMLSRVAAYYGEAEPAITDKPTRQSIAEHLWEGMDFRNLSVEVLAYIYENTLVDSDTRREQGIHSTPPSIARYVVEHLPFEQLEENDRRVVEPCSGHGIFLVAALQRLRRLLPPNVEAKARHRYFAKMLSGFEIDEFALEVSRLCLMLADFPNPNSWRLEQQDVFHSPRFTSAIQKAGIILCNPPYEIRWEQGGKALNKRSMPKPVKLLKNILQHAPANSMLGFVLPAQFIDGNEYRSIRNKLAERYQEIEVVELPEENVFEHSRMKSALLIAKSPSATATGPNVSFTKVTDSARFKAEYAFEWQKIESKTVDAATKSLAIFGLDDVWRALQASPTISSAARIHRGVEWISPFDPDVYISGSVKKGFKRGLYKIAGSAFSYEPPAFLYLNAARNLRLYKAWELPWNEPKVIMNAARVTVGHWKIAAFPDSSGLLATQNFTALWPRASWTSASLAAVLNGPVASAYVTDAERWKHVTKQTIGDIPLPMLSFEHIRRIDALVAELKNATADRGTELLYIIDSIVLSGYKLSPQLEDRVLHFFDGFRRPVRMPFDGYFSDGAPRSFPFSLYSHVSRFHELVDKRMSKVISETEELELVELESRFDNVDQIYDAPTDRWVASIELQQETAATRLATLEARARKLIRRGQ